MKDLTILPERLRDAAKAVGPDFAWPIDLASEVIEALTDAGAVVVGVEAWLLDAEGVPAVVGWSSYDLGDYVSNWDESVTRSRAEAEEVLAGVMEDAAEQEVNYVGIDWDCPEKEEAPEPVETGESEEAPDSGGQPGSGEE